MQNFTRYQIIYFRSIITVVYSHNNLEKLSEKNKKYCCNEFDGYGNFIVLNIFFIKWVWFKMYIYRFVENFMDYQNK